MCITPVHVAKHELAQVQILSRYQVVLGETVAALPKGWEEPIPYATAVDPKNINPYRVSM